MVSACKSTHISAESIRFTEIKKRFLAVKGLFEEEVVKIRRLLFANCKKNITFTTMRPTLQYIEEKFKEFNKTFFNNSLAPLPIHISNAKSILGVVVYSRRRNTDGSETYSDFRMRISARFDLKEHEVEDILIHEMIHYYILSHQLRDTGPHGRLFKQMMNGINLRYGRHITISRRNGMKDTEQDLHVKPHYICATRLPDGRRGVTVSARTRVFDMWRNIPRLFHVKEAVWYVSTDPYFNRFPNSIKPRIYVADPEELNMHLRNARELVNDGRCIMVKRKQS